MNKYKTLRKRSSSSRNTRKIKSLGFIILRHVNSIITDSYWRESYKSIRQYYPENKIVIIDDNSDNNYLTSNIKLYKTRIIKSKFPRRGELLPYYYYSRNKWFDRAVIIHDSVFVNKFIDFNDTNCKFLWNFINKNDELKKRVIEFKLIKSLLNNDDILEAYIKNPQTYGCFGAMSIIKFDFLKYIDKKYDLSRLLKYIDSRFLRMRFERVFYYIMIANDISPKSLLGRITEYYKQNNPKYSYADYISNKENDNKPLIKIWTGR